MKSNIDSLFYSYEAHKVNNLFNYFFKVHFETFWAGWMPGLGNRILIDIIKFDDYLIVNYDDYNENISMSEFVLTKFGKEAHDFLKKLI